MSRLAAAALVVVLSACGDDPQVFVDAGVDAAPACGGLELATCRRTAGCAADVCPACGCDLSYRGCLPAGQAPAACPDLACPSQECCRQASDCELGGCLSPGEQVCGGACNPQPSECTTDRDCQPMPTGVGAVLVCDPVPCPCTGSPGRCVAGCTIDDDCGLGQTCDAPSGRCRARTCTAAAPCPPDFDCVGGGCQRRTCTSDVACDHFCVEGVCRGDGLGSCQLPQP